MNDLTGGILKNRTLNWILTKGVSIQIQRDSNPICLIHIPTILIFSIKITSYKPFLFGIHKYYTVVGGGVDIVQCEGKKMGWPKNLIKLHASRRYITLS
jgi:hypothetical protein